jgi:TolB-like protein/Flp pilus assembly protein TadD
MDAKQWLEIRALFDELVDLGPERQAERLATVAAAAPEIASAVASLLAADPDAEARLAWLQVNFAPLQSNPDLSTSSQKLADPLGLAGRTFSHFHVLEPLAAGGMGVVYRAKDTRLGRPVALKFPSSAHGLDRHDRDRFLREARTAGALDHPNLCSIYEAGETSDGHLFIAMALYDGETLKARIARDGALPVAEALAIAAQIAQGLGAVHRAGIVHRDLKPANVMLLADGAVKILDFGLAKVTDVSLTMSRATLGTVSYMAPEQVRGLTLDSRTDLWALGVLLYEMLTGRRPFEGEHEVAIAHAVMHTDPIRPTALRPELPTDIDRLVQKLLSKAPARRYASAESVATQLIASHQRPVRHAHLSRFALFRPRRRTILAATTAIAITLSGAGLGAWLLRRAAAEQAIEPRIVAVLPFEYQSNDEGGEYLALGLTDAVATQLARLRGVAVPTVLGAASYQGVRKSWPRMAEEMQGKPWRQIAEELESDAIIRGTVRRTGDDVRLDIQLFETATGQRPWAQSYDGKLAALPELQRVVTQAIVAALGVELDAAERALLARLPTANGAAYGFYLQARALEARDAFRHGSPASMENLQQAHSLFARATELDSDFAVARARLASSHIGIVANAGDRTLQVRRDQARLEAEAALRLQPGLPEAHSALGYYWVLEGDHLEAVRQLEQALHGFPNSGDLHLRLALSFRTLGRWDEAVHELQRAIRHDPRNRGAHREAALTYSRLRRYQDAIHHWDRVIALDASDDPFPRLIRGHQFLRLDGTIDSLEAALTRIPAARDDGGMTTWARFLVLRFRGRYADALAMLDSAKHPISRDPIVYRPVTLLRAMMLDELRQHPAARRNYELARAQLEDSITARPGDPSMRIALGLAYAGLGRKTDASREARTAMDLVSLSHDNPIATGAMGGAVEVFARIGETDAALQLLELLLGIPAGREVSVPLLRSDPIFAPLRSDPRFERMIERFSRD